MMAKIVEKNDSVTEGTIVHQSEQWVTLKSAVFGRIMIPTHQIKRILLDA